jgi:excinuclease ABC subunit A
MLVHPVTPNAPHTLPTPEEADPRHYIAIKGARVNNLQSVDVVLPRNKLVVMTGLSGSGKSSLAFDTLFAEGQRMYVESLSSYARQFLGRMDKPDVDYVKGVSPAIAIEQKVNTRNPRSTVGTTTEIYDYLKLLFARIGITYSPISGEPVRKDTPENVVDLLLAKKEGRVLILAPWHLKKNTPTMGELQVLVQKGFTRVLHKDATYLLEDAEAILKLKAPLYVVVDRIALGEEDEDLRFRLFDSVQTAFHEGEGTCSVQLDAEPIQTYSDRFERDGMTFEEPTVNLFTFNNPYGACKTCEGFGNVLGIDHDLVIPDKSLSVYEGAIAPWRTEKMQDWLHPLVSNGILFDFPIHRPVNALSEAQYTLLWEGNSYFRGLNTFFQYLEAKTHQIQYRVMLSRYRGRTVCPDCKGTRLRKDAAYVKIGGYSITDMVLMPVESLLEVLCNLKLSGTEEQVSDRLLKEINNRLDYLCKVGLGYLTLNRLTSSLSGGEFQRIKLSTALGSALVGSMYILDEPSIGLHPRDTQRMVEVLRILRDLGNTVIVVEHEEEVMRAADLLVDIGPEAGRNGGKLVFAGSLDELIAHGKGHTADFLSGRSRIEIPLHRRPWSACIEVKGAREHNLKQVHARFPLGVLTVVTGVSGSGKSTLVRNILYPALQKKLGGYADHTGKFDTLTGDTHLVKGVELVDQSPIGKSSRSNPVTYVKAYDHIRQLFAEQALSKARGYKPAQFSFNVDGGRCDNCAGEGVVKIEMQFMADIFLQCEACKGRRFKEEILEVTYQGSTIAEVLDMTIEDSLSFFQKEPKLIEKLKPLADVGLGYVKLGQSSNTLSGGEAQRVKLASFLTTGSLQGNQPHLFIFDEPTTGLHFKDIEKLLLALQALIQQGHTVLIIEHNLEVIKSADWILDLGPDSGEKGGTICFEGTPEQMVALADSNWTARFLKEKLA